MGSGGQVSTAPDMWRWAQAIYGGKLVKPETIQQYMNPRQGMLVGGDMYGFEIMGAGDHRNAMIIMYNNGSPRRNPPLRKLGEALTALVTGRVTAKFTLGVELQVEENEPIKVARVVPGGAAEKAGLLAGDILHSANGKPIGDPPMAILAPLLQTADAIAFVIERNGEKQTIKVTPLPRGG